MNTLRKLSAAILVGALSLIAVGTLAAPAHAGGPFGDTYCRDRVVFGNTLHYYPTTTLYRPHFRTTTYLPTYNFCPRPVVYPVTLYGSFGRRYVVYPARYPTFVR